MIVVISFSLVCVLRITPIFTSSRCEVVVAVDVEVQGRLGMVSRCPVRAALVRTRQDLPRLDIVRRSLDGLDAVLRTGILVVLRGALADAQV